MSLIRINAKVDCKLCKGTGQIGEPILTIDGKWQYIVNTCFGCNGEGYLPVTIIDKRTRNYHKKIIKPREI